MENIDVSVIVPIYNEEKYLKKCLHTLHLQTLENIEIICVNDGSTDSSIEILNEYSKKDSRIKIISKEKYLKLPIRAKCHFLHMYSKLKKVCQNPTNVIKTHFS